jgi:hypothetical protein
MLDEASAVRDPEVANTINTGSFVQSANAAIKKLTSGEKLNDIVRKNLITQSEKLFRAMEPYQNRTVQQYRDIAKRQGLDERDVDIESSFIQQEKSKIRVTNGKETLLIDPDDEFESTKDGYRRAQ